MTTKDDLARVIDLVAKKLELKKLFRLSELVPELKGLDELLGHNAETARDQVKQKADALLVSLPMPDRDAILELLPRVNEEALLIGLRLLDYNFPLSTILFFHLDDAILTEHDIPQIRPEVSEAFRAFITHNPDVHIVLMSHDSADVTAVLSTALMGETPIQNGQVSIVYESGLGLYLGGEGKGKHDYTENIRTEIAQVMERLAITAVTRVSDQEFRSKFYFSSTEFSAGIRVHPYARGRAQNLDRDAARELLKCLSVALADLTKEDVEAVEMHAMNYFLGLDPSLERIFSRSTDERVWDMEQVNQYLSSLRFVHLGARGSVVRPADLTDVPAAQSIVEVMGKNSTVWSTADNHFALPLLEWTAGLQTGIVACSEQAEAPVREFVEGHGGIEYSAGTPAELLTIIDAYLGLRRLIK